MLKLLSLARLALVSFLQWSAVDDVEGEARRTFPTMPTPLPDDDIVNDVSNSLLDHNQSFSLVFKRKLFFRQDDMRNPGRSLPKLACEELIAYWGD